jgi:hypothetical protein
MIPTASIASSRLRPARSTGWKCFCSLKIAIGMCSPFFLMSSPTTFNLSGFIIGDLSAAGCTLIWSRQLFGLVFVMLASHGWRPGVAVARALAHMETFECRTHMAGALLPQGPASY